MNSQVTLLILVSGLFAAAWSGDVDARPENLEASGPSDTKYATRAVRGNGETRLATAPSRAGLMHPASETTHSWDWDGIRKSARETLREIHRRAVLAAREAESSSVVVETKPVEAEPKADQPRQPWLWTADVVSTPSAFGEAWSAWSSRARETVRESVTRSWNRMAAAWSRPLFDSAEAETDTEVR